MSRSSKKTPRKAESKRKMGKTVKSNRGRLVNVHEAAAIIGVTDGRVRQLLLAEELEGFKVNERAWLVDAMDARAYRDAPAQTGRPRNNPEGKKGR